jgi:hypothetical protein
MTETEYMLYKTEFQGLYDISILASRPLHPFEMFVWVWSEMYLNKSHFNIW